MGGGRGGAVGPAARLVEGDVAACSADELGVGVEAGDNGLDATELSGAD